MQPLVEKILTIFKGSDLKVLSYIHGKTDRGLYRADFDYYPPQHDNLLTECFKYVRSQALVKTGLSRCLSG